MMGSILVVDDDRDMLELLSAQLEDAKWGVSCASNAVQAMDVLACREVDIVLTDLRMPGGSGTDLCREIVATRPDLPVIVMTGFGSIENAIEAIRAGAYDFITKPFRFDQLELVLERAVDHRRLRDEVRSLRRRTGSEPGFAGMIGTSPAMQRVYEMVDRLEQTEASVLILGESGTGKELLARALHLRSRRAEGPFVPVNCASVPEALLESELFGHEKGAFTDAKSSRRGLFRQADEGTLFLDEVGDMSMNLQPKLLRVLQERRIRPVGGERELPVDVRVLSATNQDLHDAIDRKEFRADLYYRLAVISIELPPLRERGDDIGLLAEHFVERLAHVRGIDPPAIADAAMDLLTSYSWPGNVRELENAIEHAVALGGGSQIDVEQLPEVIRRAGVDERGSASGADSNRFSPLFEIERRHILRVLDALGGNKSQTAKVLGIDRKTLHTKLQRYGRG